MGLAAESAEVTAVEATAISITATAQAVDSKDFLQVTHNLFPIPYRRIKLEEESFFMRSNQVWMRFNQMWIRSSQVWMRSSQVFRESGCQCPSRNSPGFDPSILRHSGILGASDEAVLNNVHKKRKKKKILLLIFYVVFIGVIAFHHSSVSYDRQALTATHREESL